MYIDNTEDLKKVLDDNNIDYSPWNGSNGSKSVESLYKEIEDGESVMDINDGELVRSVFVVKVDVVYKDKQLKESKQVFKDGYVKVRDIDFAVSEKRLDGEDGIISAVRGVKEELGLDIKKERFVSLDEECQLKVSNSYIGLKSNICMIRYRLELMDEEYNPKGYIERQSEKDIYFDWV